MPSSPMIKYRNWGDNNYDTRSQPPPKNRQNTGNYYSTHSSQPPLHILGLICTHQGQFVGTSNVTHYPPQTFCAKCISWLIKMPASSCETAQLYAKNNKTWSSVNHESKFWKPLLHNTDTFRFPPKTEKRTNHIPPIRKTILASGTIKMNVNLDSSWQLLAKRRNLCHCPMIAIVDSCPLKNMMSPA